MFKFLLVLALVVGYPLSSRAAESEPRPLPGQAARPFAADVNWSMTPRPVTGSDASCGSVLPSLYVSLAALNALDAYTTSRGIRAAVAGEANPLMRGVAAHPAALLAIKGGTTAATVLLSERLRKSHHRTAAVLTMIASNGVVAMVSVHNARTAAIR
jgi:Domain of unknown function (DUF5658)